MEELINQITNRTGISQDQAQQAVEMVVAFAKSKLPEPFASQVDSFLGGNSASASPMDQVQQLGDLGGLFGRKE